MSYNARVLANEPNIAISSSTSTASASIGAGTRFLRCLNAGTTYAFVKTGAGSATATATGGAFIGPNETVVVEKPADHDYIAVILSSGTGTLYVMKVGEP